MPCRGKSLVENPPLKDLLTHSIAISCETKLNTFIFKPLIDIYPMNKGIIISLLFLVACNAPDYYHAQAQDKANRLIEEDSLRKTLDSLKNASKLMTGKQDQPEATGFPETEKNYPVQLLNTTTYHSDEVADDIERKSWFGLFKGKEAYYLKQTQIKAERVHDAVLDEDDSRSGWEISTPGQDTNIVLLSGLQGLSDGTIEVIDLPKQQLLPGEKHSFSFKGHSYTLYATGNNRKGDSGETIITDYKLYIKALLNDKEVHQMLVAHPDFDDAMVSILFVGDINKDGLPDLLIDTTSHYNALVPTLYLSELGNKKALLKVAALHMSVGC
jgi:hypothetical protein